MRTFQVKKAKIKKILIISSILAVISYVTLFTIPFYQGKAIEPGTLYSNLHSSTNKRLRLHVSEGHQYEFKISTSRGGSISSEIQLYSHSFKLVGMSLSSPEYMFDTLHTVIFTAEHGMYYYLTLNFEEADLFVVIMEDVNDAVDSVTTMHFNVMKLLLLLTPIFVILLVSLVAFRESNKNKDLQITIMNIKKKKTKNRMFSCPSCGVTLPKNTDYCKLCGRTFKIPDHQLI